MWRVNRVAETGSTNADVIAAARGGQAEGYVLVADHQSSGRGRLGRSWDSPGGTSLSMSCLLRPERVPGARWPWLPLLVGVAVVEAVRDLAGTADPAPDEAVRLKWPNDVLAGETKLAGILVERTDTPGGPAAVAGIGMNLTAAPAGAASLVSAGIAPSGESRSGGGALRDAVLDLVLARLAYWYPLWCSDPAAPALARSYRAACSTLGRPVRAELPGGASLTGLADRIDAAGRLVIAAPSGDMAVGAGDVVHLRAVR